MATLVGDAISLSLLFTALEIDLMREIAFNTGKSLDQVAAERLSHGIICDKQGEDYELKFEPEDAKAQPPSIEFSNDDEMISDDAFRDRLNEILLKLYNVAWSRGDSEGTGRMDQDFRRTQIAQKLDSIMTEIHEYGF